MKNIKFTAGELLADFSNDVFLVNGIRGENEPCVALSCPKNRIPNIKKYIKNKENIINIRNHFVSPLLGYSIQNEKIYFIYQISCSKPLIDWFKNEEGDFEETDAGNKKGFLMLYQICVAVYQINNTFSALGSKILSHIMLTDDDHPILYGFGLLEIFGKFQKKPNYEDDCAFVLSLAQKIFPSIYKNEDYINFCDRLSNLQAGLPFPQESVISNIETIRSYAMDQFDYISVSENENEDSDLADRSLSSENYNNSQSLSIQDNNNDNNNNNNVNFSIPGDDDSDKTFETSDPQKNIDFWKKNIYCLYYCVSEKRAMSLKKLMETENYVIYNENYIGLKNSRIDFLTYKHIESQTIETKELPKFIILDLEQNTKIVKSYPNSQGIIITYKPQYVPLHDFVTNVNSTEKTILVIHAVYSLILVETIYGGHGMLNKYLFTIKNSFRSKTPKIRILGAGLINVLNNKTNDMDKAKEIFKEIGLSTPKLLEKMAKHNSFVQLYKDLVSDFSWFHNDTDVTSVFYNIFSYIVNGQHPLYIDHGMYGRKLRKELELFLLCFHHRESYDALDHDENPIISVKIKDESDSTQVLPLYLKPNNEKISQFQKIDPETIENDDDLAYWAYCKATGNHLKKDVEEGKKYLMKASKKSAEAKYYLAVLTNDEKLMLKACEEKYPPAIAKVAITNGFNMELIQQAILLGSIDALNSLGIYYFDNEKYKLAYGFLYIAAHLNHPDAQWRLAMMLEKSIISGIQDIDSAEAFYIASASQRHPLGLYHYARFEEIYNSIDCYHIYKLAHNLGVIEAEIPIIAHDISKKDISVEEIFQIVESKDPSIQIELLFRIAYSLPKSKEALSLEIRNKAKSKMNEDDPDHFYAGFGLSSIFSCLREMTELSLEWRGMNYIYVQSLSPSNKVLCWSQDFPNPSIDTINLISQDQLIKLPKDAMIIRNKFTKLSKQKNYNNDPFFLMFFLLHIREHHACVDHRLQQFIDVTKEKLKNMKYRPYFYIYDTKMLKNSDVLGDGQKKYVCKMIDKIDEGERKNEDEERELRLNGIDPYERPNQIKSKIISNDYEYAYKKDIEKYIKKYPQLLSDCKCKFFRFSLFYIQGIHLKTSFEAILKAAFPSTKFWLNRSNKGSHAKELVIETLHCDSRCKIESSVNIINSHPGIICTYYNADHNDSNLLEQYDICEQFDGILYTKKKKFDGENLILNFDIKEMKPITSDKNDSPLDKSLLLADILKQLFLMQISGSKHGNITKESFVIVNDKVSIFGCDLFNMFDYLHPETDFYCAKKAIQEIFSDVPKNTIELFNGHNDFAAIYQTVIFNPEKYLYENIEINEFFDRHIPFDYHFFIEKVFPYRSHVADFPIACMAMTGGGEVIKILQNFDGSEFLFAFMGSFCIGSNYYIYQFFLENYSTRIEQFLQSVDISKLNEKELAYYTYLKRRGAFTEKENMEYQNNAIGNRLKIIEKIEKLEKEALSDYQTQHLEEMALKVKKLMDVGDQNVVNLFGIMNKYGIYCPKNSKRAEFYLSCEKIPIPFSQFETNPEDNDYNNIFLYEINCDRVELYERYRNLENMKTIATIAAIRCKRKISEKEINTLLSIEEMPYKIEAMFTAGILLRSTDVEKSKEIRNKAMQLYLSTEWSKYSDALVFFNGIGFTEPILEYLDNFQKYILPEVNVNDLLKYGCSAYKKIHTTWVFNFGEDFDIPEAVTFQLIEREQNEEKISLLYSDYSYWAKNKLFQENMFFMYHFGIFLKAHGYDKTPESRVFIAHIFKKCADENIDPASGYFYYILFDTNYTDIDKIEAIEYLKKSVDVGLAEAIYAYGVDLATGNHVVQNEPAAKMYLTQIQNSYPPAKTFLESHLRRNIFDFKIHNDDEISSGSISEMTESIESESGNENLAIAKDVGHFMMNFKDWIPLIMSIIRIIQSCSSSISTSDATQNSTPEESNENNTVIKIRRFFDWATTIIQKIATSLDLYSIKNTETSVLISLLFTFFFTFMIFSLNTNALTSLKLLISCTIFIPFAFGIAAIEKTWGYVLFIIGIVLLGLSGVVAILIRFRNSCMMSLIHKLTKLNVFIRYIFGLIFLPFTDVILFGLFLERLFPGGRHKLIKKHDIMTAKQLKIDTYLIFIISFIVVDLLVLSVLNANTLYIIITVLILIVLIILGILFAVLKIDIKRLRITINEIWMYLFVIIAESIVMVIIDHLTDKKDQMDNYVKAISSILSVIYPLLLMIFFTYKLYHIWTVTHPTYFRIWIRSTISFIARFGETVKARFFFWTIIDFIYHIIFSIVSAYGGPIANIIITIIYILLISILHPFILISDNILTVGEPIIVCLLNILLLATNKSRNAGIALGIVFIILSFVPAMVSLIWYLIKERGHEFDFLKKDMIYEYDRIEQKEGLNVISGVSEVVGYDDYKHLYAVWPGEFTETDIPELDFKNRLIETYGKDDFIPINAAALMIGYCMMYLWIGFRYLT